MNKFRKAFIANTVNKFDESKLTLTAEEVVAVCPTPLFDRIADDPYAAAGYKNKIANVLDGFDPSTDVILDYGDPLIFAMMIYYLADCESLVVGRYNRKTESYIFHTIDTWWANEGDDEDDHEPAAARH
jgi:hypothetical protein